LEGGRELKGSRLKAPKRGREIEIKDLPGNY